MVWMCSIITAMSNDIDRSGISFSIFLPHTVWCVRAELLRLAEPLSSVFWKSLAGQASGGSRSSADTALEIMLKAEVWLLRELGMPWWLWRSHGWGVASRVIGYDYKVQVLRTPEGSGPIRFAKGKLDSKFRERRIRTRIKPKCYRKNQVKTCVMISDGYMGAGEVG
jgi:hypothetical protein